MSPDNFNKRTAAEDSVSSPQQKEFSNAKVYLKISANGKIQKFRKPKQLLPMAHKSVEVDNIKAQEFLNARSSHGHEHGRKSSTIDPKNTHVYFDSNTSSLPRLHTTDHLKKHNQA